MGLQATDEEILLVVRRMGLQATDEEILLVVRRTGLQATDEEILLVVRRTGLQATDEKILLVVKHLFKVQSSYLTCHSSAQSPQCAQSRTLWLLFCLRDIIYAVIDILPVYLFVAMCLVVKI